jgi:hypothetical protein
VLLSLIGLGLYRALAGNFNNLGAAYNSKYEFLSCDDKYNFPS